MGFKVLELFAGTRSIGRAFERRGHKVFSVDWERSFDRIDLYADIGKLSADEILTAFGRPDIVWASPDCTTYSLAAVHYYRRLIDGVPMPQREYAEQCDACNAHVVLELIPALRPQLFFIENPVGCLCKMPFMRGIPKYLVTYCQYGDRRQKPTHIFTNCPDPGFKSCKRGDSCHEAAPRGAKTGTQGIKGKKDRARIPDALCDYVVELCERRLSLSQPF